MKYKIFTFTLLIFLFSCNCGINKENKKSSFVKDIPFEKNGELSRFYQNIKEVDSILGFTPLENGFDELQIKIWYGYSRNDTGQIVMFKKQNEQWGGELFTVFPNNNFDSSTNLLKQQLIIRLPKSGWDVFIKKILELDIMDLPDYKKISNYPLTAGGDGVTVEIATINFYRVYHYSNTDVFEDEIPEAKKMESILKLIESEFEFKRLTRKTRLKEN